MSKSYKIKCRMPQVGDTLIVTPDPKRYGYLGIKEGDEYIGSVYDIKYDSYGDPHRVLIYWSGETPRSYNPSFGYHGTNIHNLRHEFRVFREGEEIF